MTEFWLKMQSGLENFNTGGQYLALFLGSLFFLFFLKRKEHKEVRNYALLFTGLVMFPFTAFLLSKYRTQYYDYASLFHLLPMMLLTAWGLTEAAEAWMKAGKPEKTRRKYVVFGGLVVLVALCGTVSPLHVSLPESDGFEKIPAAEREVLEWVSDQNETEEVCLWAPDAVLTWARVSDGNLKLLYGRDMWNNALSGYTYDVYGEEKQNLYEWMNIKWVEVITYSLETEMTPKEAFKMAAGEGCTHVVLQEEQLQVPQIQAFLEEDNRKEPMLKKVFETTDYEIFEIVK